MEAHLFKETIKADGTSSLREHTLKPVWEGCANHYFELPNGHSRIATCKHCGMRSPINFSTQDLVEGVITKL